MKRSRLIASLLLTVLLSFQVTGWAGVVYAKGGKSSPSPTPTTSPSPSASPDPSDSPAPTPTPSDSPSPSPSASPDPSDSPSPSPTPSASPDPTTGPSGTTGADPSTTGPQKPTGNIPTWALDTITNTWVKTDKSTFAWDPTNGYWLSPDYVYDPHSGYYEIMPAGAVLPSYDITAPVQTVETVLGDLTVGTPEFNTALSLGLVTKDADGNYVSTAPLVGSASAAGVSAASPTGDWFDLTNLVNVINNLTQTSTSGDAAVSDNTTAADASSGGAEVLANVINLLASAWSWTGGDLATFIDNIFGNQTGDITIDPSATAADGGGSLSGSTAGVDGTTGTGSNNDASVTNDNGLTVNAQNSGNITNNIDANSASGDATVAGNTVGGNATTGDATTMVDLINLIDAYISSGDSFFGMINIFGNLNGDILFPDGLLSGSAATDGSNAAGVNGTTGPNSNNTAGVDNSNNANIDTTNTNTIANNINANAASGDASTAGNTSAGNATTGSATSNTSLFNLAGTNLVSDNAVLVIVNVMGHWIGSIMNLGGGSSTSALLTGANTSVSPESNTATVGGTTGPDSNNNADVANNDDVNANVNNDNTITNNVNAGATTGNADVTDNTTGGNATSGNANVATDVANITNSTLNITHWFGVLLINVFGTWTGDVNQDTSAGDTPGSGAVAAVTAVATPALVAPATSTGGATTGTSTVGTNDPVTLDSAQLTATEKPNAPTTVEVDQAHNTSDFFELMAGLLFLAALMIAIERKLSARRAVKAD